MGDDDDATWRDFHNHLEVGQFVDGVVVEHRPFGMFVDIGSPRFLGLVELPSMDEAPRSRPGRKEIIRPAVGTRIKAVFVGFASPNGRQPRLHTRQSALRAAEALQHVADLPLEQRRVFLQQALYSHEPGVPAAAIWKARRLLEHERGAFLREALRHPNSAMHAQAVGRVVDLPAGERMAFLKAALAHENERIAWLAVWESAYLLPKERVMFLRIALQHADPAVAWRAQYELKHFPGHEAMEG